MYYILEIDGHWYAICPSETPLAGGLLASIFVGPADSITELAQRVVEAQEIERITRP